MIQNEFKWTIEEIRILPASTFAILVEEMEEKGRAIKKAQKKGKRGKKGGSKRR